MVVSQKVWELPNSRILLTEIDIDRGLDFPIYTAYIFRQGKIQNVDCFPLKILKVRVKRRNEKNKNVKRTNELWPQLIGVRKQIVS